jgi:glutamyl-tRNA synthetase
MEIGEKITLMKWGNAIITKKEEKDGFITIWADLTLDDKDYKKTKKVTWIAIDENTNFEVTLVELDHLITKKKVEENERVQDIVNHNSRIAYTAIAEGCMKSLQKGSIIQLERRGYFYVDKLELHGQKMTLNFIPDGKSKNMSKIESKLDQKQIASGKTDKAVDEAKDKKKKGGAAEGEAPAEGLSKKEANKLAKKQQQAAAKAAKAAGEEPPPKPMKGTGPQGAKAKGGDA